MTEALAPPSPLQTCRGYSEADVRLLRTFEVAERHPAPGFIVDFLGVRTRVTSLASAQRLCEGVLDIPVPGDYHAEAIEYVGVLQSRFTFVPGAKVLEAMNEADGTQVWRNPRLVAGANGR